MVVNQLLISTTLILSQVRGFIQTQMGWVLILVLLSPPPCSTATSPTCYFALDLHETLVYRSQWTTKIWTLKLDQKDWWATEWLIDGHWVQNVSDTLG